MHRSSSAVWICAAIAGAALLASCGDGNNNPPPPNSTTVDVSLQEFSVTLDQSTASAGDVTFHVTNNGEDMHEFLVIKTDLPPGGLPTLENGAYAEDGPGTDLLDEIEDIDPGDSKDLTLNLSAGHYVLICNMVMQEYDELEVHYALGMRTAFTVE